MCANGTGSIQLARVFGIRIGASPSWFVVALIFIVWLSTAYDDEYGQTTGYVMAVVSVALFFFSLTLHELGHAWVARRNGIEITGIDLWFFGGIASSTATASRRARSFRVSAAGPAVTLLIVVLACVAGVAAGGSATSPTHWSCATTRARAGRTRVAGPGQRRALRVQPRPRLPARRRAHRAGDRLEGDGGPQPRHALLARLGQGFSYFLMALGVFLIIRGDAGSGIWWILMGWFLGQSATGASSPAASPSAWRA
jgi:hypothetical protein